MTRLTVLLHVAARIAELAAHALATALFWTAEAIGAGVLAFLAVCIAVDHANQRRQRLADVALARSRDMPAGVIARLQAEVDAEVKQQRKGGAQ